MIYWTTFWFTLSETSEKPTEEDELLQLGISDKDKYEFYYNLYKNVFSPCFSQQRPYKSLQGVEQ